MVPDIAARKGTSDGPFLDVCRLRLGLGLRRRNWVGKDYKGEDDNGEDGLHGDCDCLEIGVLGVV